MYTEKRALIITEKDEPLESTAQSIKNCLHDFSVKICSVNDFAGTDILPAQIFFLGCNSPNPANFSYLEDMLSHINLVSRKCGIFSSDKKSLEYLAGILKDCEADLGKPFLITNENDKPAIENWLKGIKG